MIEIFQGWMQDFFKVFVDVLNIHKCYSQEHVKHMNLNICTTQGVGGGGSYAYFSKVGGILYTYKQVFSNIRCPSNIS